MQRIKDQMSKELNPVAEAALKMAIRDVCYIAILELRDTLRPQYNPLGNGYKSVEHARLTIIEFADRQINKLSSEHLRKHG